MISWEAVFLLAFFRRLPFFFLIIVVSFIVPIWGCCCIRDRQDSYDCNTLNLFFVRIADNGEPSAEFMVSFHSRSASPVVLSFLLTLSWLLCALLFLFNRFGGRLSFRVLWVPKLVLPRKFLIHFCYIFLLVVSFILSTFFPSLIFLIVFIVSIIYHFSLLSFTV